MGSPRWPLRLACLLTLLRGVVLQPPTLPSKPTIHSRGNNLIISSPNDTIFRLGSGDTTEVFSTVDMIAEIGRTLDDLRTTSERVAELRDNLTATMAEILEDANEASELVSLALECAERNLTLGSDNRCINPAVTCPRFGYLENMTVSLSPEGLAYERLPGTIATFYCMEGHVDPIATRAFCTALGTWSRAPPASCDSCETHLPNCEECGNGTCTKCSIPYILNGTRCVQPNTCDDVEESGEYRLKLGFSAFCLVEDGKKWMKISEWGSTAPLSTGARNPQRCATPGGSDCKLSDLNINAVITAIDNGRFYRVEASGRAAKIYLYTNYDYRDNARSWGINPRQTKAMVNEYFLEDEVRYHAASFTQDWVDFYYMSDSAYTHTTTCERYFIGHNTGIDCYGNSRCNCRCIRGGSSCELGQHAYIPGWTMYIATA